MQRLDGRAILVTGSASGIGEAIARRCLAEGARVFIHGLEPDITRATAEALGCPWLAADLADAATPAALVSAAIAACGRLDGLVNNAAWIVRGGLEAVDAALFDRVMAINVRAPLLLIREALPHLEAARGAVVNIGSVNANAGEENLLPYSISKGALQTLSRNLGDTLHRRGVRVNQINPGWVLTDAERAAKQAEGMAPDWWEHLPAVFAPAGRIFRPDEIAAWVALLLSDESGPVSGSVIDVEQYPMIGRNPPKC